MIFVELFLVFLGIGTAAFGGGYGVISLIRDVALSRGWLTEEELLNFIAVSESTPGPIAVNMATFVGSAQGSEFGSFGSVLGAFLATLGVVLPAFVIMFVIVKFASKLMQYAPVEAALGGIRPAVVGLILSVAVTMLASRLLGFGSIGDAFCVDWIAVAIFATVAAVATLYRKLRGKKLSPILLICVSAVLGAVMYGR